MRQAVGRPPRHYAGAVDVNPGRAGDLISPSASLLLALPVSATRCHHGEGAVVLLRGVFACGFPPHGTRWRLSGRVGMLQMAFLLAITHFCNAESNGGLTGATERCSQPSSALHCDGKPALRQKD